MLPALPVRLLMVYRYIAKRSKCGVAVRRLRVERAGRVAGLSTARSGIVDKSVVIPSGSEPAAALPVHGGAGQHEQRELGDLPPRGGVGAVGASVADDPADVADVDDQFRRFGS